jgi:hypothetical protein
VQSAKRPGPRSDLPQSVFDLDKKFLAQNQNLLKKKFTQKLVICFFWGLGVGVNVFIVFWGQWFLKCIYEFWIAWLWFQDWDGFWFSGYQVRILGWVLYSIPGAKHFFSGPGFKSLVLYLHNLLFLMFWPSLVTWKKAFSCRIAPDYQDNQKSIQSWDFSYWDITV